MPRGDLRQDFLGGQVPGLPRAGVPECENPTVAEAPVRMSKNGLVVDGEGWFVVNARESRWKDEGTLGSYCTFEGKRRFPHFGINISVFEPGERMGMYHREKAQEAFLVLDGECTLIVEGKERVLRKWDFFYCEPGTEHIIVAGNDQKAVVLAVGGRGRGVGGGILYTVCKAAARYGASVARETTDSAIAYAKARANLPRSRFVKYRRGWLPD
jgi:quercetin dioxygenase-like cupin family protein